MAVEDEQYGRIMSRLRADLPVLAEQLDAEVRSGRLISEESLFSGSSYQDRKARLAESKLPKLAKSDIGVLPYTGSERLDLVRDALLTLAETMSSSRKELLRFTDEFGVSPVIEFSDFESASEPDRIDLNIEAERAQRARNTMAHRFGSGGQVSER
ncbi:hypothetical protein [Glycomyces buryatensis]|uniref:Uncharacterized protein n=1 Tax=Glycomyces buryatensis TaxID=2570927 RepID=A0A4V4HSQ8_9ACTN|nr:hypothetical protein [Glycomyces buryatensis]THV42016.1 hypothetical protein FAB82_08810 [Glycomyces buryatensis]